MKADVNKITEEIIGGKEIRSAISEGFFSELAIDLGDEINSKLNKLKAEDPLYFDKDHKSFAQNKKDLDDFIKKLDGYGVDAEGIIKKFTDGKDDVRWTEVWLGLQDNLTK